MKERNICPYTGKEIKPCPFCGSLNVSQSCSEQNNKSKTKYYFYECLKCASMGQGAETPDKALVFWNTRVIYYVD